MKGQLTTEQVLLLENLMYLSNQEPFSSIDSCGADTVEEWIESINMTNIEDSAEYGSYMTGRDWKNIIQAVKNDSALMNMEIVTTHVVENDDHGGGGVSAIFKNPETSEAVVAFRGTAAEEWKDNFTGGAGTDMADGVSTMQQQKALEWYRSQDMDGYSMITVTGHSKGGNKAQYIALLDDSVSRCISFDGQGFSDEFVDRYRAEIEKNQGKITNHSVDHDYVNLLLNAIGQQIYYEGYDYGEGGFLENHCPNTYFQFDESGNYSVKVAEGGQAEEMRALDEFFNSYLRSLPTERKADALAFIGEIAEMSLGRGCTDLNEYLSVLLDGNNTDETAYLIAYLIEYEQKYPELMSEINRLLKEFDMDEMAKVLTISQLVLHFPYFDQLYDSINSGINDIPDWLWTLLSFYLKSEGIDCSKEDILQLLGIFTKINDYMDSIEVEKDGSDRVITSELGEAGNAVFSLHFPGLQSCRDELEKCSSHMEYAAMDINTVINGLEGTGSYSIVRAGLRAIEERLRAQAAMS